MKSKYPSYSSTWTCTFAPLENFNWIFMEAQKCQPKVISHIYIYTLRYISAIRMPLYLLDRTGERAEIKCHNYQELHIPQAARPGSEYGLIMMGFPKELLYQSHRGLPASLPGFMASAVSFASSSTCWHWKGSLLCPVPSTKSLFCCHTHLQLPLGRGASYRSSPASTQHSPVLASDPSWMSTVLWTEFWPLLSWAAVTGKQHTGSSEKGEFTFEFKNIPLLGACPEASFFSLVLQPLRTPIWVHTETLKALLRQSFLQLFPSRMTKSWHLCATNVLILDRKSVV